MAPMLDEGVYTSVSEIGDAENISKSYVSRILRLALLAPDIVDAILVGSTDQGMGPDVAMVNYERWKALEAALPQSACWSSWSGRCRRVGRSSGEGSGSAVRTTADDRLGCFRRCTCAPPAS